MFRGECQKRFGERKERSAGPNGMGYCIWYVRGTYSESLDSSNLIATCYSSLYSKPINSMARIIAFVDGFPEGQILGLF